MYFFWQWGPGLILLGVGPEVSFDMDFFLLKG